MKPILRYIWLPLLLALAACQATPPSGIKIGKPYEVDGTYYRPSYDPDYDQIGEASWYGPGFHGKYTASGEIYDQAALTAAHPTLPMPSLVRVTNLQNGKSEIVRINDRGPFKSKRIIDLSKAAAKSLGIKGVAQVRVQYLKKESEEYIASQPGGAEALRKLAMLRPATPSPQTSSSQVVESTVSNTTAGQTINAAAPIMTVRSGELEAPEGAQKSDDKDVFAGKSGGLIHEAYANENVTSPRKVTLYNADEEDNKPPQQPPRDDQAAADPRDRGGGYYIQAGVFSREENARKMMSYLTDVDKVDISQYKGLWRVRLGPYDGLSETQQTLRKVRAAGADDAQLVYQ